VDVDIIFKSLDFIVVICNVSQDPAFEPVSPIFELEPTKQNIIYNIIILVIC